MRVSRVLLAVVLLTSCQKAQQTGSDAVNLVLTDFRRQPKLDPWETPNDSTPMRGNPQGSVPVTGTAAPGFASTTIGWPSAGAMRSATRRVTTSSWPPAGNGTIQRMGLSGQPACACAAPAPSMDAASAAAAKSRCMRLLLLVVVLVIAATDPSAPPCAARSA